jgi:hypothetical protein
MITLCSLEALTLIGTARLEDGCLARMALLWSTLPTS